MSKDKQDENLVTGLPEIKSGRFSQTSKVSLHSQLQDAKASMQEKKPSMKSFQLAEQFQADQIINDSKVVQLKNLDDIETNDIKVQNSSSHVKENQNGPNIDFHGVRSTRQSQLNINSNRQSNHSSNQGSFYAQKEDPHSIQSNISRRRHIKKLNAWETFEVQQFKDKSQEPGEFIHKLMMLTAHPIPFMGELPIQSEMDSTDPMDSFIQAVHKIMTDKSIDYTDEVKKGIHLATGIRTEFCENLLRFICHHQKCEQAFVDAVDFFMDSLKNVVKLEEENKSMNQDINDLLMQKEEGILGQFNLEKRLKNKHNEVDKITLQEKQAQNKIKQLQLQLQDKVAENESLEYRLKHYEEITGMMDPPQINKSEGTVSGGAVPITADEDLNKKIMDRNLASNSQVENAKLKDLQSINKKLEEELSQLREFASEKDNSDHFRKIQELFNNIQIENKNLRIYNQKCESKLQSKQNLVNHLEDKVTAVMVDKEEIVIKLKSEIVLLKNKLELNEEKFKNKLEIQRKRLEYEFKVRYDDKINDLEGQVSDLDKQRKDLRKRLTRLHKEHEDLSAEFNTFRREKEEQEGIRNRQYKQLEDKHSTQQDGFEQKERQLKTEIEGLENKNETTQKENDIIKLRLKYLKQQTETLAKQKVFLFETLGKGKSEIQQSLQKMENTMMDDNNNQAYLVSVEKCIKQAKKMADMGTAALSNISQILQFLKIEKLHQLLSDESELDQLEKNIIQQIHEDQEEDRIRQEQIASRPHGTQNIAGITRRVENQTQEQITQGKTLQIQRFLNKHGMGEDKKQKLIQDSPSKDQQAALANQQTGSNDKNENYYLENCPIELASICVKVLIDVLVQIGMCKSVSDVPEQVSNLLMQCNKKSDLIIENEIKDKFLSQTKDIIDKQILEIIQNNKTVSQISEEQKQSIQEQIIGPQPNKDDEEYVISNQTMEKTKTTVQDDEEPKPPAQEDVLNELSQVKAENEKINLQLQQQKIKLDEQKMKSRNLQLNLAGKIVVLEEQIEQIHQQKEEQIKELEKTHQEELQKITQGVDQREGQLLQLCDEYRDEVRDLRFKLETSWRPPEESKTVQKMEKGTRGNLYRLMKEEYERLFNKNSELLHNYQASINEFVYLREDLRGSFTLAFDYSRLDEGLINMLNEPMLKYYLSKVFVLDKSKFRFLRTESLAEKKPSGYEEYKETQIMKVIIEVVAEDQAKVVQLFKNVKAQIKDGTSLLYDFMPLYFGMNLGSSGFSTHHNLKDFTLLSKVGQMIDGEDYVVSVMRNKLKPLVFKVIAFNLELREEFMMELSESDIYEIVEGDQQVLKNLEPDQLIKKISTNLNLIVRDKIKVLTCEQKIFFNSIWMENMQSCKNTQVHTQSMMETNIPHVTETLQTNEKGTLSNSTQLESKLLHTATRTNQLSPLQHPVCSMLHSLRQNHKCDKFNPPQTFIDKFSSSIACQTDYEISTLYEGFENVFRGVQKVGEITHMRLSILESTKSHTLIFTFDDLTSLKKLKFSLYEKEVDDQYVIHAECMKINEGHHVLIAVEQIQQQGLLIKMYDMLECKSVSFSLLRKQNGQYTRMGEETNLDLLMKGDFRNFIYELTFVVNQEANEQLMQNMQYIFKEEVSIKKSQQQIQEDIENQKQRQSIKRESDFRKQASGKILPRRKRNLYAQRVYSFSQKAFFKDKWSYLMQSAKSDEVYNVDPRSSSTVSKQQQNFNDNQDSNHVNLGDWRDQQGEKGVLLYRNIFNVRCVYDGADEYAQESVISLYHKDNNINIEVSLYKDQSKMSIASSVLAIDLFGDDPSQIPFRDRVMMLNNMMEKFFIIKEEGVYHMKVESEAIPIQDFLEEQRRLALSKNPKEKQTQDCDVIITAQKIQQIQDQKEKIQETGEAIRYQRITDIDGEVHTVEMLFLMKEKTKVDGKGAGKQKKQGSKYGKTGAEKRQFEIEEYIDLRCPWDSIYFEISDSNDDTMQALYDKKKLAKMLSKDEFIDWKSAIEHVDPLLLDYIKRSIQVDKLKGEVSLHNKENIEQNIYQKFRKVIGGNYVMRNDLDLQPDELKIIQKQMIANSEIEMSEFLYDIKIFQIQKLADKDIIAYQVEIFSLYDPDVVYVFNYPMNYSTETHDPHSLVIDVINLIENPLQAVHTNKKGQKKGGERSANIFKKDGGQDTDTSIAGLTNQQKAANTKSTFKQLFRKYIDNRILLFIQETRFPRKLDFILSEPSSMLQWRSHIEPRQITTGMSSMHLADQATLEQFVAVLLDENEHCQPEDDKLFEYQNEDEPNNLFILEQLKDDWSNIKEVDENSIFIKDQLIVGEELLINIFKRRDAFCIDIQKPSDGKEKVHLRHPENNNQEEQLQIIEELSNNLEIRVNPLAGDQQVCKVLKENGLSYCILLVKVIGNITTIKVVKLYPNKIETALKFVFVDEKPIVQDSDEDKAKNQDEQKSPIFTSKDLQASTVDALRRYYGAQTMEQAMRMCTNQKMLIDIDHDEEYEAPTIFEQMDSHKPSIHNSRMMAKYMESLETKTMILYRKTFFDDNHEKLILMYIQLKYIQKEYQDPFFDQEVETLNVVLQEPETSTETIYVTPISQFLTPEEYEYEVQSASLKDMRNLKKLSKKFLEDRVVIRRIQYDESQENQDGENSGVANYAFDITFEKEQQDSNMHLTTGRSHENMDQYNQYDPMDQVNDDFNNYIQNQPDQQFVGQQNDQGQLQQQTIIEEDEEEEMYKTRQENNYLAEIEENVSQEKYQ